MKKFKRDYRSPNPKDDKTSHTFSRIKSKNTKPEILLRKKLWESGVKGYRIHSEKMPGKPDILFSKQKLAIFVNGCFWHRCPKCDLPLPTTNSVFWKEKFSKNIKRDILKTKQLEDQGIRVIVFWECEINQNVDFVKDKVMDLLSEKIIRG